MRALVRASCIAVLAGLGACTAGREPASDPALSLFDWERGIGVRAAGPEPMAMYLWFYEWSLFDAIDSGQLGKGRFDFSRGVAADGRSAWIKADGLALAFEVEADGVALTLEVENRSDHDWPEQAALIACFNPGPEGSRTVEMGHHLKTYFITADGLERLPDRDLHFNAALRPLLAQTSPALQFDFTGRWASSERDAQAGVLLREALHGGWTSGIAWSRFVAVQAHNPWLCMHVATQVGPLARGAKTTLRGRIYLFPGDREQGLARYRRDFP